MALPVPAVSVAQAYDSLRGQGLNTKSYFQNILAQIGATPAQGDQPATIDSQYFLSAISSSLNTLGLAQQLASDAALSAAIDAYVKQMSGNPTLDVHTELQTSMAALGAAVGAMIGDYPKDASGHLLDRKFNANGSIDIVQLAPSSLNNSASAMAAWLATIV